MLAHLLSVRKSAPGQGGLAGTDPQQLRRRTFAAVRDYLIGLARLRPTVVVFEDLHWADGLSLDLLYLVIEELHRVPLLVVCTYRPEQGHRSSHLSTIASQKCGERYREIRLSELSRAESGRLVRSVLGPSEVVSPLEDLVLSRCQGNPFFIEEMVRVLLDEGVIADEGGAWRIADDLRSVAAPESVQSVVMGRIGRLREGWRRVLDTASVIGRVFPQRLLATALERRSDLESALWELEDRALVYQERTIPEVEYSFRHVLLRDTVYRSMVRTRRQHLHAAVAAAIEAVYAESLDEHLEELAVHCERCGDIPAAIGYLLRAGQKARRNFANEEAISHLRKGLALLSSLPRSPERDREELGLQLALGVPLVHSRGHSDPGVREIYARARDLAQQVGAADQLLDALFGLRRYHLARGEMTTAYDASSQAVSLAEGGRDPLAIVFAHMLHAETCYWMGRFSQAYDEAEQSLFPQDASTRRAFAQRYGNDGEAGGRIYGALALWQLGYPDKARRTMAEASRLARGSRQPFTQAFTLCFSARLHRLCGEGELSREFADSLVRLSEEHDFALYSAAGEVLHAQIGADRRPDDAAVHRLTNAIARWRELGVGMWLTEYAASIASALGHVGRVERGLDVVDEGLQRAQETGECCWLAELQRLRGELLLKRGDGDDGAEESFRRAVQTAREQGSKAWELRAVTSLGRLMQVQGRTGEARELVRPVYAWFTEGFDTADLRRAKELLRSLEHECGDQTSAP
jgi:tetratricopeptide (TPR) repeat protein